MARPLTDVGRVSPIRDAADASIGARTLCRISAGLVPQRVLYEIMVTEMPTKARNGAHELTAAGRHIHTSPSQASVSVSPVPAR